MAEIDPKDKTPRELHYLMTGLVVPRPIAWVSSISSDGVLNLAPFSLFNIVSYSPPMIYISPNVRKDTYANIHDTKEFVVNVVNRDLLDAMNQTAIDMPSDGNEFDFASVEWEPARRVAPPRVKASPASLECVWHQTVAVGDSAMVIGEVVSFTIADHVLYGDERISAEALDPVGRLSGAAYMTVEQVRELKRPRWEDVGASVDS